MTGPLPSWVVTLYHERNANVRAGPRPQGIRGGRQQVKILFLHGWQSTPGGLKLTYLKDHGHTVLNPALSDDDFEAAVRIAQGEFDQSKPDVVVGSSRGGAVAMNMNAGATTLVLLCPAWAVGRWQDQGQATGSSTNARPAIPGVAGPVSLGRRRRGRMSAYPTFSPTIWPANTPNATTPGTGLG
jgi:hypothetical protein